jgi:hypothetical protein
MVERGSAGKDVAEVAAAREGHQGNCPYFGLGFDHFDHLEFWDLDLGSFFGTSASAFDHFSFISRVFPFSHGTLVYTLGL